MIFLIYTFCENKNDVEFFTVKTCEFKKTKLKEKSFLLLLNLYQGI